MTHASQDQVAARGWRGSAPGKQALPVGIKIELLQGQASYAAHERALAEPWAGDLMNSRDMAGGQQQGALQAGQTGARAHTQTHTRTRTHTRPTVLVAGQQAERVHAPQQALAAMAQLGDDAAHGAHEVAGPALCVLRGARQQWLASMREKGRRAPAQEESTAHGTSRP